jgi:hypothetical protein
MAGVATGAIMLASVALGQSTPASAPVQAPLPAQSTARNPTTIEEVAQTLAQKIARMIAPGPIALRLENSSSLNPADQENFKRELTEQLRVAGIRVVQRPAAAYEVVVTVAENLRGNVFVAQSTGAANQSLTAMVALPRGIAIPGRGNTVVLRKSAVLDQETPILDFALAGTGAAERLIVLESEHIVIYLRSGAAWQTEQVLDIPHRRPFPRDLRGRLQMGPDRDHWLAAYLPGTACTSSAVLPLTLSCHDADDPWPLLGPLSGPMGTPGAGEHAFYNAARNMFTGIVLPALGEQPGQFYSAAQLAANDWLFITVQGRVKEIKGGASAALDLPGWGTDVAALRNGCGGINLLATGAGDYSATDTLHFYDWTGAGPAVNADPLEFSGPITAIWTNANGSDATVVSRNVKSGRYEAYLVTANCAQ